MLFHSLSPTRCTCLTESCAEFVSQYDLGGDDDRRGDAYMNAM